MDGQAVYSFDDNGNLLNSDTLTNTFDAANRLVSTTRDEATVVPIYNGVNDRVGQTVDSVTTDYALDVVGLPEVTYTSEDNAYLHLPGVIVTESTSGEVRYLLSDGLGSVRQVVDENAGLVSYQEFDPYGNPTLQSSTLQPYGYSGEWWQDEVGLLHLRARWYAPGTGTFLSVDPVESEPPYQYVRGNVVNLVDPSGLYPPENCRTMPTKFFYRDCILRYYDLEPIEDWRILPQAEEELITGTPGCDLDGPVLYRGTGYVEGDGLSRLWLRWGTEYVYDFATMQRAKFSYDGGYPFSEGLGGVSDGFYGVSYMKYMGTINGFRSAGAGDIISDYSEDFYTFSGGLDGVVEGVGFLDAWTPDGKITSRSIYIVAGLSNDIPIGDIDYSRVYYTPLGRTEDYAHNGKVDRLGQLLADIDAGNDIFPAPHPSYLGLRLVYNLPLLGPGRHRANAKKEAVRMAKIYEEIHSSN